MANNSIKIINKEPLSFLVDSRLLDSDDRFDTWFFHPQFVEILEQIENSSFEVYNIGDSKISMNVFDGIHKTPKYTNTGVIFIQANNIEEGEIDFQRNVKHIDKEWKKEVLKRYSPKSGDILITKDGTIGIAATVPENYPDFSIFVSVAAIRPNTENILSRYLEAVLNTKLGQKQIARFTRGAVLSHLLLEEIRKIKVPLPSYPKQIEIANILEDAYAQRKARIAEASALDTSINNLVFSGLGVKNWDSTHKSFYPTKLEEDLSARMDPAYYSLKNLDMMQAIQCSQYSVTSLGDISKSIVSGQRPKGGVKYIEKGVPSIGGEHISSKGDFDFSDIRYVPHEFHARQNKSWIRHNDILIVKDGATTGKTAIVLEDFPFKDSNINEHVFKLSIKEGINPYYAFCYLFSSLGQEQIQRLISGAVQKGITKDAMCSIKIIIPPIDLQNDISENVKKAKEQSRKLIEEAQGIVNSAKDKVSNLIIG